MVDLEAVLAALTRDSRRRFGRAGAPHWFLPFGVSAPPTLEEMREEQINTIIALAVHVPAIVRGRRVPRH